MYTYIYIKPKNYQIINIKSVTPSYMWWAQSSDEKMMNQS